MRCNELYLNVLHEKYSNALVSEVVDGPLPNGLVDWKSVTIDHCRHGGYAIL